VIEREREFLLGGNVCLVKLYPEQGILFYAWIRGLQWLQIDNEGEQRSDTKVPIDLANV